MSDIPFHVTSRSDKEKFVTGHQGTSMLEIHNIIFFYMFNVVILKILEKRVKSTLLEPFFLILFPCLSILHPWLLFPWFTLPMTIGLTLLAASRAEKVNKKEKHLESITAFRGILMVLTVFSILAVDFQVFPRRFAKTELYGTSLMDIGVGIFVFMQGIVHGLGNRLRVIRWSLFLMGCTRLLLMSLTDYPSHVTEYGTHWNFFFTLMAMDCFNYVSTLLCKGFEELVGFVILALHQTLLTVGGLSMYIQHAPRDTFFSMNREGILSLPGYFALHLLAHSLGKHYTFVSLLRLIFLSLLATPLLVNYVEPISRRLANAGFVCWITGTVCFFLFLLKLIEKKFSLNSWILNQISKNMLLVFLVANVATGFINLSLDTLNLSTYMAHAVLLGYMILVVSVGIFVNFPFKKSTPSVH